MKNIHILPTNKPSRLIMYSKLLGTFRLLDEPCDDWQGRLNIHITNDEKINEGDWFLDDNNQISHSYRLSHVKFANPKKIILTTDQDLIKDGVQAIDDEFLEWFVNNPSCEEIEVYWVDFSQSYFIKIPKEEPEQETTLEEVAEIVTTTKFSWQQERMYSQEEVELIANEMVNWAIDNIGNPNPKSGKKFDEVIAKFKKK